MGQEAHVVILYGEMKEQPRRWRVENRTEQRYRSSQTDIDKRGECLEYQYKYNELFAVPNSNLIITIGGNIARMMLCDCARLPRAEYYSSGAS
jgi:hypothetical protein